NTVRLNLGDDVHLDLDAATGETKRYYGLQVPTKRFGLMKPRTFSIPQQKEEGGEDPVDAGAWGTVELHPTKEALEVVLSAQHPSGRLLDRWDVFFDFRKPEHQFGLYDKGAFQFTIYPKTDYNRDAVNVYYKYFPRWKGRVPRPEPGEKATRPAEVFPAAGPLHPPIHVEGIREEKSSITQVRIAWADLQQITGFKPSQFGFATALLLDDPAAEPIERTRLFAGESASRINNGWPIFDLQSETDDVINSPLQHELLAPVTKMPEFHDHPPAEKDTAYENSPPYRIHPLTRRPTRRLFRPAYGCAYPISGDDTAFFRSGSIAYYDYEDDTGVRNIFGIRPGCLYNSSILPAMGLVLYSERSSGCACNYNFQTSFALVPTDRRRNEDWAVYYDKPAEQPVRTMNLNFGVPGDR
ncbi:MAG: hypothetical protein KDA84_12480, partial [Planctomycetaceae bacterium]|nr:hypothetical protein [Planctomycetaceae bacterium]